MVHRQLGQVLGLTTARAGVLGSPIAHSLSPVLHNAGYAALSLTQWSYAAARVEREELAHHVASLDDSWRGLSLTMPLKEVAFDLAETVSHVAAAAGAINTLVRTDTGWAADNTDVHGLSAALADAAHDGTAVVVGAGATTRSALLALQSLGIHDITVAARRAEAVEELVRWAAQLSQPTLSVRGVGLDEWTRTPQRLVVSTVPPAAADLVADGVSRSDWLPDSTLLDVVYADWPTAPARAAQARGIRVISGLDMLVHQAAAQFAAFTGQPAPLDAMFAAGRAALGQAPT